MASTASPNHQTFCMDNSGLDDWLQDNNYGPTTEVAVLVKTECTNLHHLFSLIADREDFNFIERIGARRRFIKLVDEAREELQPRPPPNYWYVIFYLSHFTYIRTNNMVNSLFLFLVF
jgi:hypothetical protein